MQEQRLEKPEASRRGPGIAGHRSAASLSNERSFEASSGDAVPTSSVDRLRDTQWRHGEGGSSSGHQRVF